MRGHAENRLPRRVRRGPAESQDDPCKRKRSRIVGDKGGKKDKDKARKQKEAKQEQQKKEKQDKQQKTTS